MVSFVLTTSIATASSSSTLAGRSRDIQLFETYLLAVMNFQTLIATKAARIVDAAQGESVFDFGARRAHGRDAGILAARAAFIGGAQGIQMKQAGFTTLDLIA